MKLYIQDSNGEEKIIAEVKDEKSAFYVIEEYCNNRGFNTPYVRCWGNLEDNGITYDFGSHSQFFVLRKD